MKESSVGKFKAELNKYVGFVLCTPLCGLIFNGLVFSTANNNDTIIIRVMISAVFAAVGVTYIIKAIKIMEEANASNNKLSKRTSIA